MTNQTNFFSQPQNPPPQLNAPANPPRRRVYVYDNQYFDDPGPDYTPQDVLRLLAQSYPELENGTWTTRTMPDGAEEIAFVKVTGEKGNTVSPRLIVTSLFNQTSPASIQAIETLKELAASGPLSANELLALAPQIEAALQQADRISEQSTRIVARCLLLKPVPHPRVPLGF